jgi:choline dehydrogenase-like flavoprotein
MTAVCRRIATGGRGKAHVDLVVVGSGPAGVAAAAALLKKGRRVLMLDGGQRLEPDRAHLAAHLAQLSPQDWSAEQRQILMVGTQARGSEVPQKLLFGSDFPYRGGDRENGISINDTGLQASLAVGGLSTVWGAAMLPYADHDLDGWPVRLAQLAPHYKSVLQRIPLSAIEDDLSSMLPIFTDAAVALRPSRQAALMHERLSRNRAALRERGIVFGQARVGIRAASDKAGEGCVYCGMCMQGCPYGYIYSAEHSHEELRNNPAFSYRTDAIVNRVEEHGSRATVRGHDRLTRQEFQIDADRVLLAAGAIPTTGILLRSLGAYDRLTTAQDSQHFVLPLILLGNPGTVREERLHALSQLFIEILDATISPYTVHLQIYTYSDILARAVRGMLGPFASWLDFLARRAEARLLVVQGYLHSAESGKIAVALRGSPGNDRLELTSLPSRRTTAVLRRVMGKLVRNSRRLGAVPLPMLLKISPIGRGFHTGGTFPMRERPDGLQSDVLGRPVGFERVSAVDAAVLPSIPATTITLTVMANAHRIASEV